MKIVQIINEFQPKKEVYQNYGQNLIYYNYQFTLFPGGGGQKNHIK